MSEIKHTPGPWFVSGSGFTSRYVEARINGGLIQEVAWCGETLHDEQEANARLIAAAPDLLADLQSIANAKPEKWDEEVRDQFQQWAQSRARAAIAKATGSQS